METKHASEKNLCVNSEIRKDLKYLRQMKMKHDSTGLCHIISKREVHSNIDLQGIIKTQTTYQVKELAKEKTAQCEQKEGNEDQRENKRSMKPCTTVKDKTDKLFSQTHKEKEPK